jgi:uncharacterized membrane protein
MSERSPEPDDAKLYSLTAWLLRVGNAVSIALLTAGLLWMLVSGSQPAHHSGTLAEAWRGLLQAEPAGFLNVGLQTVILTPIGASASICIYAIIRKQRSLLTPSLLVLGGLVLSLWIGIAW